MWPLVASHSHPPLEGEGDRSLKEFHLAGQSAFHPAHCRRPHHDVHGDCGHHPHQPRNAAGFFQALDGRLSGGVAVRDGRRFHRNSGRQARDRVDSRQAGRFDQTGASRR